MLFRIFHIMISLLRRDNALAAVAIFSLLLQLLCTTALPQDLCLERISSTSDVEMVINLVPIPISSEGGDWFVAGTQAGIIEVWFAKKGAEVVKRAAPLIDLSDRVVKQGERGLLGVAFHENFVSNGRFFVSYSCSGSTDCKRGDNMIEEYRASGAMDPSSLRVDIASARTILQVAQPAPNHNGGQILFSPNPSDPYLYAMFGDGGGIGDPNGHSQNISSPLGKVLRLDVDSGDSPYSIPPSNPFVGIPNAMGEIWALGLRNPWRCSFDRLTYRLYCGDVGQDNWEEVNVINRGGNYGWNLMEGHLPYEGSPASPKKLVTKPVLDYSHTFIGADGAASITGGYVYRPQQSQSCLAGNYIFGDFYNRLFIGIPTANNVELKLSSAKWKCSPSSPLECGSSLADLWTFGEAESGTLYLSCAEGVFRMLEPQACGISC